MARSRTGLSLLTLTLAVAAVGCGSKSSSSTTIAEASTTAAGTPTVPPSGVSIDTNASDGVTASGISDARCAENKKAGKITFLTGFDFAAASSIVEVVVAEKKGYFDKMCLDVDVKASFSTANYPLVAGNQAQFASSGSLTELAEFSAQNEANLVGLSVDGRTAIDTLIAKPDKVKAIEDLKGATIGVKGKIPPSIKALLALHGLTEGTDYQTVLLEGYDPKVHFSLPSIAAFPGWKSNEVGQLTAANIAFTQFDPTKENVPGSFGIIYTNKKFLAEHPTAVQDFMRAAMKGLADALADPDEAAGICVDAINANGNKNFLSPEGEKYRWQTESALIKSLTPKGTPYGLPAATALADEIAAYTKAGVFEAGKAPATDGVVDTSVLTGIYDSNAAVIWPAA